MAAEHARATGSAATATGSRRPGPAPAPHAGGPSAWLQHPAGSMTCVIHAPAGPTDAPDMAIPPDPPLDGRLLSHLRTEHVRVLRRAARLERALRGGGGRLRALELRSLRAFAAMLAGPFVAHLDVEERDTFTRLARAFPELGATLARLREEHAELRAMISDLVLLLEREPSAERDEKLFVLGTDLTELLRLHIHAEEHAAYGWIARLVPPARQRRGSGPRGGPSGPGGNP